MFNESNISIIIPTYNGEKSITSLIENLVKNFPNYEIVIINDNSPDKSDEVCKKIICDVAERIDRGEEFSSKQQYLPLG